MYYFIIGMAKSSSENFIADTDGFRSYTLEGFVKFTAQPNTVENISKTFYPSYLRNISHFTTKTPEIPIFYKYTRQKENTKTWIQVTALLYISAHKLSKLNKPNKLSNSSVSHNKE